MFFQEKNLWINLTPFFSLFQWAAFLILQSGHQGGETVYLSVTDSCSKRQPKPQVITALHIGCVSPQKRPFTQNTAGFYHAPSGCPVTPHHMLWFQTSLCGKYTLQQRPACGFIWTINQHSSIYMTDLWNVTQVNLKTKRIPRFNLPRLPWVYLQK